MPALFPPVAPRPASPRERTQDMIDTSTSLQADNNGLEVSGRVALRLLQWACH